MAQIALYKPANERMSMLRSKALDAYKAQLDQFRTNGNSQVLLAILHTVDHTPHKLEAFNRLPVDCIDEALLKYFSRQEFRYTPEQDLQKMFATIRSAGWQVSMSTRMAACTECGGSTQTTMNSISINSARIERDHYPCPECDGQGNLVLRVATCKGKNGRKAILSLPKNPDN